MLRRRVGFARWTSAVPSGGNRYDDEVVAGLRGLGIDVAECVVPGSWPRVGAAEGRRLAELLLADQNWLVGNILAAGAPEAIRAVHAAGRRVTVLVHYFPADEIGWSPTERDRLARAEGRARPRRSRPEPPTSKRARQAARSRVAARTPWPRCSAAG